ncbi:MAG: alpha/beta hydrolase [Planctomycetota bacterium]
MTMTLLSILATLFIAYTVMALAIFFLQSHFVYFPTLELEYTPQDIGLDFEDITFETEDGIKLNAWYIPAPNAEFTILFCHGNGGNISHRLDSINLFNQLEFNCFIFDYRGYGLSEGNPSEQGTYIDARAAYQWLLDIKNIQRTNIIIFGRSLGASIASHLATKIQPRTLVIESAFTSVVDMGKKLYPYLPIRWFARFNYSTIDHIKNVECPVMVIHSPEDEIIPYQFGLELFEAANEPKEFVEISGTHNDGFITSGVVYLDAWLKWKEFLKEYESRSEEQPT